MISEERYVGGLYTHTYSNHPDATNYVQSFPQGPYAERKVLSVFKQRSGDHKSPNDFGFLKIRTTGQSRTKTTWYSRDWGEGATSGYVLTQTWDHGVGDWDITGNSPLYMGEINWPSLNDHALERVFDQMRYGHGNLAVDLAESAQTLRMIRNASSVRRLAQQFVREFQAPKGLSGSRRLKYASDKWLEGRYGWLPFVSSTYELLKTLSKRVDKATRLVKVEGRASQKKDFFVDRGSGGNVTKHGRQVSYSARLLISCRMRARSTLELYDFTSLNPALIAWELVPLSFVADWFFNVGQTMKLWEDYILFANRFVDGFQTATYKEDVLYVRNESFFGRPPVWPNGKHMADFLYGLVDNASALWECRVLDRTVLGSLPSPGGLRVDVNVGAKRMLDACALLRSVFGNPKLK